MNSPKDLHQLVVSVMVTSFLSTKGEEFSVCSIPFLTNVGDPTITAKDMSTRIVQKKSLIQTDLAPSLDWGDHVLFSIFQNFSSSLLLINEVIEAVWVKWSKGIEHECPSLVHAADIHFVFDIHWDVGKKSIDGAGMLIVIFIMIWIVIIIGVKVVTVFNLVMLFFILTDHTVLYFHCLHFYIMRVNQISIISFALK